MVEQVVKHQIAADNGVTGLVVKVQVMQEEQGSPGAAIRRNTGFTVILMIQIVVLVVHKTQQVCYN